MKRISVAVLLLLAVGLSTGCSKDYVNSQGIKVFGQHTQMNGTVKVVRLEFPDGSKEFDITKFPDGTQKAARVELPNGEKRFDVTRLPDGTKNIARATYPDGTEKRNIVQQAASGTSIAVAQEQSEPDTDACVEGAKDCEGKAAGIWLVETQERRGTSYSCPDPQAEALIKISLVHGSNPDDGSKLDVASVRAFQYGSDVNLWGADVYNTPKYGEKPDGSYHLRGERQFVDQDADVTLELHPRGNGMKYFISARRSGSGDILFLAQGTCTKVADKSGFWAINPSSIVREIEESDR